MGRGFLSGIFWGGIVGLVALFVSSQALDRQSLSFPRPEATAVEVPGGSEFNQARPETDPVVPGTDARPESDIVTGVAVPDESGTEPPALDTAALEVPVPATTQEAPESLGAAPEESANITEPATTPDTTPEGTVGEALVTPESPGPAPDAGVADVEAPAGTDTGEDAPIVAATEDPAPPSGDTELAALPGREDAPVDESPAAAPQVTGQTEPPGGPTAPEIANEPALSGRVGGADTALDEAPEAPKLPWMTDEPSLPPTGAEAPEAPRPANGDAVDAAVEEALGGQEPPAAPEADTSGESIPQVVEAGEGGSVLQPVETFTERDEGESMAPADSGTLPVVRRLGDSSTDESSGEGALIETAPEPEETVESATDAAEDSPLTDGPALRAFATEFETTEQLPLLSIVLVHEGEAPLPSDVLEILPTYIGFAVDASSPNASAIAAAYRAMGREVVMIPSLPAGAAPQDIEQALAANFDLVPEAVAVMDVSGSSFQSDRAAVEQVVDVVAASGHGLITFPRGLNTAHQAAQRAGVPTGLIFRNLDAQSETQEQIRRTLDRAAFRARQDEAVILVGTTGSRTLSALTEWLLGNRATTVTIAPVSVALGG